MYVNNILKNNIDIKDVNTCLNKIEKIENEESKDTLKTKNVEAKLYLLLKNKITSYSNNGIVTSRITMKKINDLYEENNKLNSTYKNILATEIDKLKNEYDYMKNAKNSVKNLLNEKDNLKNEVNREEYDQAKKLVENLKQKDLKIILSIKLNQVDKILTEKEEFIKAQDEQKKQEEIKKEMI